jgi:zona occludens toxin
MALLLITGTPGSGKTLYAVSKIMKWVKEGRRVYADIDGLNIEGVELAPDDWRTTPEGSVVIYDEAQQRDIFKKTRGTLSDNKIVSDFEIHRHTGHDIVFITQSPIFLHTHIRELIGEHYHLHRPYGAKLASVYSWRMVQNNPNTKSAKLQAEATTLFNYDKKLFDYYKSATIHTHKLKLPSRLIMMIALILIASIGIYYYANKSTYLNPSLNKKQETSQTVQNPLSNNLIPTIEPIHLLKDEFTQNEVKRQNELYSHNLQIINQNPLLHVSGVIIKDSTCRAFNQYGERINMPQFDCFQSSDNLTSVRNSNNDLRSNAHQETDQQSQIITQNPTTTDAPKNT